MPPGNVQPSLQLKTCPPVPKCSASAYAEYTRGDRRKTRDLQDAFEWHHDAIAEMDDDECEQMAALLDAGDTFSTAYSGIGAPETSLQQLHSALEQRLGRTLCKPTFAYAIEWDTHAQRELDVLLTESDGCLYGDIGQFFDPVIQPTIEQLKHRPDVALEALTPIVQAGGAVTNRGKCLRHPPERKCKLPYTDRHAAGTSCVAFSAVGAQRGLGDISVIFLLAWIALRLMIQEAVIKQENVQGFPTSVLSKFLGRLYFLDVVSLDP